MNKAFKYMGVVFVIVGVFVAIASYKYLSSDNEVGPNLITAFVGVVISALVTLVLLNGQTKDEEEKEKNIKVYENKIQVYSEFISNMWKTLEDDVTTEEEIRGIRSDIFNKLIFYYDDIDKLVKKVDRIKSTDREDVKEKDKKTGENLKCFSEITELLRVDVERKGNKTEDILSLWSKFGLQPRESASETISNKEVVTINNNITNNCSEPKLLSSLNCGFWHFTMWNATQIESLRNGLKELNLVEYGEVWRTNLLKQVQKGDLIFLFRSGGPGYLGVFRAIGWRVFEFDENNECREFVNDDEGEREILDPQLIERDCKKSDIYNSRKDGSTLCSSIIVEPLAWAKNGIGNPGGVYRRTISRYNRDYGLMQLSRFMAIKDDSELFDVDNETGKLMGCDKKSFEQVLAFGDIQPAPRNEKGAWL